MAATRRKKLYFNVDLRTATNAAFPCTQFWASYTGDNYGAVLDDLTPLTASSTNQAKRMNSVAAWLSGRLSLGASVSTTTAQPAFVIDFINATTVGSGATALTNADSALFNGSTPIFTRHFAVRVRKIGAATGFRSVLNVQRQHSFEI